MRTCASSRDNGDKTVHIKQIAYLQGAFHLERSGWRLKRTLEKQQASKSKP
jgi:hypothetical protein